MLAEEEQNQLEEPSECPDVLQQLFNHGITELLVTSKVGASSLGSESARLKPEGTPPKPAADPAERFKRDWSRSHNNADRLLILKDLQEAVLQIKYSPNVRNLEGTLDWKIACAMDMRPSPVVAQVFGISPSYVRTLRSRYRRHREDSANR